MNRATRSCVALVSAAWLGGALTACETLFDLPDGHLVDGGDGAPGEEGGSGGADGGVDAGLTDADASWHLDGAPGSEAGVDATTGDASPSDGSTPDGAAPGDASGPETGPEAGAEAGPEAGPGCPAAALAFYVEDSGNDLFHAEFAVDKLVEYPNELNCVEFGTPQHLSITRAGAGWLLDDKGVIHDVDLSSGTCTQQGTVTGGAHYDEMALTFARPGTATTDALYTCSPAGLGTIDLGTYAWSLVSSLPGIDHGAGCTIKPGRDGTLAILASSGDRQSAEYTLYEVDASGAVKSTKDFGTAIYDDGNNNGYSFDFAWSSADSLYYVYGPDLDDQNGIVVWSYDPSGGTIKDLFELEAYTFFTAGQSTCAQ